MPSISEVKAVNKFSAWLKTFKKQKNIFVIQNGFLFDGPLLAKFYKKHDIALTNNVKHFADTLYCCIDLFKDTIGHKLRTLAAYCAEEQITVHDAQDDSFALKMIWDYLTAREKTPLALLIGKYFRKFDEFTANIN